MRAGHYEEFFYDVHPHAHSLYARHDGEEDHSADRVIRATCVFLVLTDWAARPVEQAVDYIADRVTGLSSRGSAVEIVSKERHIAIRLGYGPRSGRLSCGWLSAPKRENVRSANMGSPPGCSSGMMSPTCSVTMTS